MLLSMLPRELLHTIILPRACYCRSLSSTPRRFNVVEELESRGMVEHLTSRAIRKHVDKPVTVYLGVDPSARSLHVGNLLALVGLLHFRLKGHNAIALIGGATGSVGDPSGRSTERNALSSAELNSNVKSITRQLRKFLNEGVPLAESRTRRRDTSVWSDASDESRERGKIQVENNMKWLGGMSLLEFLSTVGKTARISTMLSRESVKSRLDSSSGLSFTEFTYQLLQAFDFLTLHQRHGCTIQLGGSDQLGNITSGIEMIRKSHASVVNVSQDVELGLGGDQDEPAYGLTMPLLTTASGEKFGKSAGNAVWLDPSMTSPFEFYQFFLRTTDEEVHKYLKIFTFIRVVELDGIMAEHKAHPDQRIAQKVLASEATELIHGTQGLRQALAATELFYSPSADVPTLNIPSMINALDARPTLSDERDAEGGIPSMLTKLKKEDVLGQPVEKVLLASGLVASKTQARKAIEAGTIQLNNTRMPAQAHARRLEESDLLGGCGLVVLKLGKTAFKAVIVE